MSLENIKKFWPKEAKRDCARLFIHYSLKSLFEGLHIHSDPHPKNYGFRPCLNNGKYSHELVLYDFGSTLKIQPGHAATIHQMIQNYIDDIEYRPLDYLAHLDFDLEKLAYIDGKLPALMDKLLHPFRTEGAYFLRDWHIKEHFESILGEEKWWFRTAGPPWFLMLMRAMQGALFFMMELDEAVPFQSLFLDCKSPRPESIPTHGVSISSTACLSKNLRILVLEGGREVVKMALPARSVDDLENLVSEETAAQIKNKGLDILSLKSKVQRSGYTPQDIFKEDTGQRSYRVWLD